MRKGLFIAVVVAVCGCFAVAQDYPKAELFGGFSEGHVDVEGATPASTAFTSIKHWYPGWEAAVQFNLTKLLGVKADFSGNYGTPVTLTGTSTPSARTYTFLFGPVLSLRGEHATPFVHALFGGNHLSVDASPGGLGNPAISETAFAMAFGGGLDVKLTRHFGLRLGQFDYLYTGHCINVGGACTLGIAGTPAAHQNNFRFATGVTIAP